MSFDNTSLDNTSSLSSTSSLSLSRSLTVLDAVRQGVDQRIYILGAEVESALDDLNHIIHVLLQKRQIQQHDINHHQQQQECQEQEANNPMAYGDEATVSSYYPNTTTDFTQNDRLDMLCGKLKSILQELFDLMWLDTGKKAPLNKLNKDQKTLINSVKREKIIQENSMHDTRKQSTISDRVFVNIWPYIIGHLPRVTHLVQKTCYLLKLYPFMDARCPAIEDDKSTSSTLVYEVTRVICSMYYCHPEKKPQLSLSSKLREVFPFDVYSVEDDMYNLGGIQSRHYFDRPPEHQNRSVMLQSRCNQWIVQCLSTMIMSPKSVTLQKTHQHDLLTSSSGEKKSGSDVNNTKQYRMKEPENVIEAEDLAEVENEAAETKDVDDVLYECFGILPDEVSHLENTLRLSKIKSVYTPDKSDDLRANLETRLVMDLSSAYFPSQSKQFAHLQTASELFTSGDMAELDCQYPSLYTVSKILTLLKAVRRGRVLLKDSNEMEVNMLTLFNWMREFENSILAMSALQVCGEAHQHTYTHARLLYLHAWDELKLYLISFDHSNEDGDSDDFYEDSDSNNDNYGSRTSHENGSNEKARDYVSQFLQAKEATEVIFLNEDERIAVGIIAPLYQSFITASNFIEYQQQHRKFPKHFEAKDLLFVCQSEMERVTSLIEYIQVPSSDRNTSITFAEFLHFSHERTGNHLSVVKRLFPEVFVAACVIIHQRRVGERSEGGDHIALSMWLGPCIQHASIVYEATSSLIDLMLDIKIDKTETDKGDATLSFIHESKGKNLSAVVLYVMLKAILLLLLTNKSSNDETNFWTESLAEKVIHLANQHLEESSSHRDKLRATEEIFSLLLPDCSHSSSLGNDKSDSFSVPFTTRIQAYLKRANFLLVSLVNPDYVPLK